VSTPSPLFDSSSPLRDPVGLVARSPELRALAGRVPALRRAIERGRPHEAYRALYWASLFGRLGDLTATGKALLTHRRIFFRPLSGAPTMFTYNGIGTSLYGRGDFDPNDGTYVATLFAVIVFVPVFPIASYLVRDGQGAGMRRSWGFLAKVPLEAGTYFWQRAIALSLLGLLTFGAAHAFEGYGHSTFHVVNGLDAPVHVELAGAKPIDVTAGGRGEIRAAVGSRSLVVKEGGREIESATVDIPRAGPELVWNVLGAAPIYLARVVYLAEGQSDPSAGKDEPELYCGQSLVKQNGVDYLLTDPPQRVSMPEHTPTVRRLHLGIAPGGLETCKEWLLSHEELTKATRLAIRVAAAERIPAAKLGDSTEALLAQASMGDAEAFAKDLLARDDSIEAHRVYQNLLLRNDLRARAIAEYDSRLAAHPNDPDAEYLALRARTLEEERKRVDAVVGRYPDHAFLRRAQVYVHYAARDFAGVLAASEALRKVSPSMWREGVLERHVEALVALGRGRDALDLAREAAADSPKASSQHRYAELLAFRVAHRLGVPQPAPAAPADGDGADEEAPAALVQAVTGIEVPAVAVDRIKDEHTRDALRIVGAARASPESALALVRKADARSLRAVPTVVHVMLLAEAARRDEDRSLILRLGAPFSQKLIDDMVAYVTGGASSEDVAELPLELLAGLDLGRSRLARLSAKDRRDALERAKQADVLRGPVTIAIQGWPS
jgi:hypothetical protein